MKLKMHFKHTKKGSNVNCVQIKPLQSSSNSDEKMNDLASTGIEPATFALLARRSNQLS